MKICLYNVTASFIPGGLETYCWEAGRALARRGHEVTVVAGNRGEAWHDEVRLVQFPFRIEGEWPDLGKRFQRLMERLSFARAGVPYLVSGGFDAVLICKPFDFPSMWWARRRGMRSMTVFHSGGTDFFACDGRFEGAIDKLCAVSRYNARQIEARYGRPTSVIHNGVDTGIFRPLGRDPALRAKLGAGQDDVLVASLGRLVGWKGIRVLLEALAGLPARFRCIVIGTGPEEESLKRFAQELGLEERVAFLGRVPHAEIPGLLSQCDVFAQPSIGEEAFGISVIEAMACGLPVLASNNGGLPEIIVEGETGHLVEPGNVDAWRSAIVRAGADTTGLAAMGAKSRALAEAKFTWAACAARLEAVVAEGRACAAS
jgi:glycosyltransferase involved in cell wall biosynthesis